MIDHKAVEERRSEREFQQAEEMLVMETAAQAELMRRRREQHQQHQQYQHSPTAVEHMERQPVPSDQLDELLRKVGNSPGVTEFVGGVINDRNL